LIRRTSLFDHASLGAAVALAAMTACAPPAPPVEVPPAFARVAEVHRAQCGNCHTRVEPGKRTSHELESAFRRHRTRVHMSEDEWTLMIQYLSGAPAKGDTPMPAPTGDKEG
jgi:hypothetical protein